MINHKKTKWGTPQKWGVLEIRYKPTGKIKKIQLGIKRMSYNNELVIADSWGYEGGNPTDLNHPDNYEIVNFTPTPATKSMKKK